MFVELTAEYVKKKKKIKYLFSLQPPMTVFRTTEFNRNN